MKKAIILSCLLIICKLAFCQNGIPKVVFQSGFGFDAKSEFTYSPGGRWLAGSNVGGEYVLWDVKTGKQVGRITPFKNKLPQLPYTPRLVFSGDDRNILFPEFPLGNCLLYDLMTGQVTHTITPPDENEFITNTIFSPDSRFILAIGEKGGAPHFTELLIYNLNGVLVRRIQLYIPPFKADGQAILKLVFSKAYKEINNTAYVQAFTINNTSDQLYFSTIGGKCYALPLKDENQVYIESEFREIRGLTPYTIINALSVYHDKLIAKGDPSFKFLTKPNVIITDTLFVINPATLHVERKVPSNMVALEAEQNAHAVKTYPVTTNQNLSAVFDTRLTSTGHYQVSAVDVLSGQAFFTYNSGSPHKYYTAENYHPGELNGGYIVALSQDKSLMAECSLELLVHNTTKRNIQSVIPALKGNYKIGGALFLDSGRVLIPKFYNDGFVFNMRSGTIERLQKQQDCQDTLHSGANVYYNFDDSEQIGIQNSTLSPVKNQFVTTNIIPKSSCRLTNDREIAVWNSKTLTKIASYYYPDREYTYTMSAIPGYPKKFMVNYKLIDFENEANPKITPLIIAHKRDTFFTTNPVYLASRKLIFGLSATRSKPGDPNLMFNFWDINGKLIKSISYPRAKSKQEFQTFVSSSQLSPDSTKILFCLLDGTAGIFDLQKMAVTSVYEHGSKIDTKSFHTHNNITSACFIDNEHFVTNGENSQVQLWLIGQSSPEKVVNKFPNYYLSLKVSPDRKYLLGVGFDKTLHYINIATGDDDIVFLASGTDAYTVINKDGYYMSSQNSANDLSFFYNGQPYEFAQFDLALNRPDKVLSSLAYLSPGILTDLTSAIEKRLDKAKFRPPLFASRSDYDAPEMELKNLPDLLGTSHADVVNFSVVAADAKNLINKLFVTVNGVPLYGSEGKALPAKNQINVPVKLQLSAGVNKVSVSVMNSEGTESLHQSFSVTGPALQGKPILYVVAIGCSKFAQTDKNLKYAVKDARDIVSMFKEQTGKFRRIIIDTLFDQQVTNINLANIKKRLLLTRPDDMVVLYYAGHGLIDDKLDYYLSTYQTDFRKPSAKGLSYDSFERLVDSIPSRNKMVFIDACYSGEIDKGDIKASLKSGASPVVIQQQEKINSLIQTYFTDLRRSNGASEIGASGPAEEAQEQRDLQNGVFTYFLKKGLHNKEADLNHDNFISVSELGEYLQQQVFNYTQQEQKPTLRHQNIINNMLIWN